MTTTDEHDQSGTEIEQSTIKGVQEL